MYEPPEREQKRKKKKISDPHTIIEILAEKRKRAHRKRKDKGTK